MINSKQPWLGDIIALVCGSLLPLSFAPYDIFPIALISMVGLLGVWLNTSAERAAWRGFLFGMSSFGFGMYWIYISIHTFGGAPIPLAVSLTAVFVAVLATFIAATGFCLNHFFPNTNPAKIILAFPALWVFIEWIRSWIFTGLPWLLLGYSQTNSPLRGYAPILSVYGVSFATLISSSFIVIAYLTYRQKNYLRMYISLFLLASLWIAGGALSLIPWTQTQPQPLRVSLVQGNIPQSLKWDPMHVQLSLDRYSKLTQPLWQKNALIIWPEAAIPISLQDAQAFINGLQKQASVKGATLLMGIPAENHQGEGYFNTIISLGKSNQVYMKSQLVPFGEYIPWPRLVKPIYRYINIPMVDMIPGKYKQKPFEVNGIRILPFICYEIIFPELALSNDPSIGALLTVTNDAWYGHSSAQAQHLQMAQMRSIENRRPGLFVSNDGITAVIAPDGKMVTAPPFVTYVLTETVYTTAGLTPWQRYGMDPILLIIIVSLIVAVRFRKIVSSFRE